MNSDSKVHKLLSKVYYNIKIYKKDENQIKIKKEIKDNNILEVINNNNWTNNNNIYYTTSDELTKKNKFLK